MFSIDQENENPPASGPASDSAPVVVMTCAKCMTSGHSIYECRKIVFLPPGAESSSSSSSSEESVDELPINNKLWLKIRQTKPKEKIENDEESSIKTDEEAEEVTTSFSSARKEQDSDWSARGSTPIDLPSKTETATTAAAAATNAADQEDKKWETKKDYINNWLVGKNQVSTTSTSDSSNIKI